MRDKLELQSKNLQLQAQKLRILILPIVLWDTAWKGLALWTAARRKQRGWFLALLFSNTAGILPIMYLKHEKGRVQT